MDSSSFSGASTLCAEGHRTRQCRSVNHTYYEHMMSFWPVVAALWHRCHFACLHPVVLKPLSPWKPGFLSPEPKHHLKREYLPNSLWMNVWMWRCCKVETRKTLSAPHPHHTLRSTWWFLCYHGYKYFIYLFIFLLHDIDWSLFQQEKKKIHTDVAFLRQHNIIHNNERRRSYLL